MVYNKPTLFVFYNVPPFFVFHNGSTVFLDTNSPALTRTLNSDSPFLLTFLTNLGENRVFQAFQVDVNVYRFHKDF